MTQSTTHRRLPVDLTQIEGNAYFIGALREAAKVAGWSATEIDDMTARLTASDFDNLVRLAMEYCE